MRLTHFCIRASCLTAAMTLTQLCTRTLCLLAALSFLAAPAARAAFVVNVDQVGSDVVMTGSGTLNVAALNHLDIGGVVADVHASVGELIMGPTTSTGVSVLDSISGPSNFGSAGFFAASSGSGDAEGVSGNVLLVSSTSGTLSNTDTYTGKTLASLGLTVGTYVWTWGSGPDADSFTIQVNPVPEPASLSLLAIAGLAMLRRRDRASNH